MYQERQASVSGSCRGLRPAKLLLVWALVRDNTMRLVWDLHFRHGDRMRLLKSDRHNVVSAVRMCRWKEYWYLSDAAAADSGTVRMCTFLYGYGRCTLTFSGGEI
jgi:hypothetical protein